MTTLSVNYQVNITDDGKRKICLQFYLCILTLNNVRYRHDANYYKHDYGYSLNKYKLTLKQICICICRYMKVYFCIYHTFYG